MFNRSKKFMTKNFLKEIYQRLEEKKMDGKININLDVIIIFGWKK